MLGLLETLFWVYGVASWCMCFYVLFSCGEGLHWFLTMSNYLLIFGALVSLAALPFTTVPAASILIVFSGWSFYAMLVTAHYYRFGRLWLSHIVPVNVPLVVLFLWAVLRQAGYPW